MRLNPTNPSDNPMDQILYCFGSGDDNNGGGSAGDFDDSYNQAMGYTDSSGKATGTGGDSDPARTESGAIARTSNYDSQIEAAARSIAGGNDYTDVFAGNPAAYNEMQSRLSASEPEARVVSETLLSPELQMVDPLIQEAIKQQQAPRTKDLDYDKDIFAIDDYNFPGIAGPAPTPKSAADLGFVQDTTPRTKEEKAMAEDRGYFNYQDLNKDGTVTGLENILASQAFGLVGRASDIGRRMSVGDPKAGLDYESEAYGVSSRGIENGGGDGDQQAAPAVTAPVAPATCPPGYRFNEKTNACEYVGQAYPGATSYTGQPMSPSTQYTGIGGLPPFVLQPSYTPPTSFAPLYNVG